MIELSLDGKTLLVVDDETDLRDIVASELEFMGAKVFQAENVARAEDFLEFEKIDLVISDIRMPGGTGIDLLTHVKSKDVNVPPVILITGFADIRIDDAFDKGAEALMNKPFNLDELIMTVARFTRPVRDRFVDPTVKGVRLLELDFIVDLEEMISKKECALGRGGIALVFDNRGKKIDLNEYLEINLKFKDITFRGVAVGRWLNHLDRPNFVTLGLEFVHLESQALDFLINYQNSKRIVAFIPSL